MEPKVVYKGTQSFRHDLFRLSLASLKRNQSFKKGVVKIEEIQHSHFFHTFDSNGRAQTHCTPTGGHFHEVKWEVGADGILIASCGPALRHVYKKRGGQQRKITELVKWDDEVNDKVVVDSHTHDVVYAWSEEITTDTANKRRNAQEYMAQQQINQEAQARSLGLESNID